MPPTTTRTTKFIILSGRSGAGKTSIANEISHQLRTRQIPHANIDGDNLDAVYPEPEGGGVFMANLEAMWSTYSLHCPKVDRLVVSGTAAVLNYVAIEDMLRRFQQQQQQQQQGNGGRNVEGKAVVLTIGDEVAKERLRGREVGSELRDLVDSSNKMAGVLEDVVGDWAERMATDDDDDGKGVVEMAVAILRGAGWIE